MLCEWSVQPDDLELPDPSEPTEEVAAAPLVSPVRVTLRSAAGWWPFDSRETILLALIYVAPFAARWLVAP